MRTCVYVVAINMLYFYTDQYSQVTTKFQRYIFMLMNQKNDQHLQVVGGKS